MNSVLQGSLVGAILLCLVEACGGSSAGVPSLSELGESVDGGREASKSAMPDAAVTSMDAKVTPPSAGVAGGSCSSSSPCDPGLECVAADAGATCLPPTGPQMTYGGGRLETAMEVWTVVWAGDESLGETIDDFTSALLTSEWWQGASEYGIGPGKAMGVLVAGSPPVRLAENGSDYDTIISNLIGQTTLEGNVVPPPNKNTVFSFIVPKGTTAPGGYYHYSTNNTVTSASGTSIYVPYAVDLQDSVGFVSDMDYLTWSISHELVETATDPMTSDGWNAAAAASNSEVADLCNDIPVTLTIGGSSQMVTRFWSAQAAAMRTVQPCIPAAPGPYFNVALGHELTSVATSKEFHLVPFSFGPSMAMHWRLYGSDFYELSPKEGTNSPGDDVVIEVTRKADAPDRPTDLQVWVTDPSAPNAEIPIAEWFGGLIPGGS